MSFRNRTDKLIDFVIPAPLLADREMRARARMFVFSHLFGPFLGNVIPAYLFFIDPGSHGTLAVLAASITAFWLFPIVLRMIGYYRLLCYASIQNLLFAILWGSFFYGGISSPFLPWLVTAPLLAFFYLGSSRTAIAAILSQVAINCVAFVFIYVYFGEIEPRIPLADLQVIGIISTVSAAIYVSMMAIYYARVLYSQSELEAEVAEHLATAAELRAAATEADRAGAAKADFLAKMSHELRTPLNAVIGYSEMLLEDADPRSEPQTVADLKRINAAGTRLLSIVNSILDLSKIEAGKMVLNISDVAVGMLIDEVVQRHFQQACSSGTRVAVEVETGLATIRTDELKLARILDTLVSNAIEFTNNGNVTISAAQAIVEQVPSIRFTVSDTGSGIAPELLPVLFDDFTRRNDQRANNFAGAGLGLPLAYRLCQLLGATIRIESVVAVGSRVTVDVPTGAQNGMHRVGEPSVPPIHMAA